MNKASAALDGALIALGAVSILGGVAAHQPCSTSSPTPNFCGQPVVNGGTVVGAAALGLGVFGLAQKGRGGGQSRIRFSTGGGVAHHNRRARYRRH
jgi:hypothetical protein